MRTIGRYVMALTAGGALLACSTPEKPAVVTPATVEGKTWVLGSLNNEQPVNDARVTLAYSPTTETEGKVNGRGPCNGYFGDYRIENGVMKFGPVGSTMMACPEPVMKQEMAYLAAFQKLDTLTMKGDRLVLKDADGNQQLTFMAESAHVRGRVESTTGSFPANSRLRIRLQSVPGEDARLVVLGEQKIDLQYAVDGPVSFNVAYAPHLVRTDSHYQITVEVREKGRLTYTNKSPYPFDPGQVMNVRAEPVR